MIIPTLLQALVDQTVIAVQTPLPRVFHELAQAPPLSPSASPASPASPRTPGGHLVKTDGLTTLVPGGEMQAGAPDLDPNMIFQAQHAAFSRLHEDVMVPLQAWLDALGRAHVQAKELERVRLEVDSRRRTVADLTVKEAYAQAALQRTQDAKHSLRLEEATAVLRHKSEKLAAAAIKFNEQEASLHAELSSLVQDTVHLRNYAANALCTLAQGLTDVAHAVAGDTVTVPLDPPPLALQPGTGQSVPGTIPAPAAGAPPEPLSPEELVAPAGHLSAAGATRVGSEHTTSAAGDATPALDPAAAAGGADPPLEPAAAVEEITPIDAEGVATPGEPVVAAEETTPRKLTKTEAASMKLQGLHVTTPTQTESSRVAQAY